MTRDIDKAFSKGFTYKDLADATGEKRSVDTNLPLNSADILLPVPGLTDPDESMHYVTCDRHVYGTKDSPRAFSMKLKQTTVNNGLKPTSSGPEFGIKRISKHPTMSTVPIAAALK